MTLPIDDSHDESYKKDLTVATLLALIPSFFGITGLGHIYAGSAKTGIAYFFGALVLIGITAFSFPILALAIWIILLIVSTLGARASVKKRNAFVELNHMTPKMGKDKVKQIKKERRRLAKESQK